MSRKTLWINLSIALALVLVAAFAGQVNKWQKNRPNRRATSTTQPVSESGSQDDSDQNEVRKTEILVRFRPGSPGKLLKALRHASTMRWKIELKQLRVWK